MFKNSKVLVVGGAGFVGSNLVKLLLSENAARVLVVDNLLSAEKTNIPNDSRVSFVEGSIANDSVLACLGDEFDYVFHLATYHGNQSSIHDPIADHDNNTITSLKLFNRMKDFKRLKKLVYSGAGCAVAAKDVEKDARPTSENAPIAIDMDSPYSISKIIGEFYAVYFHKQNSLPAVRARFQNVYGPGEILGAGKWRGTSATVWRNVTPTFVFKSLQKQSLPLDNEGKATRDFIFVDDICRGLVACALKGRPGEVYNLATGQETSIRKLAETINCMTGNPNPLKLLPPRPWDHSICRLGSTEKASKELGFETKVGIEEGLAKTIAWTKDNLSIIQSCMRKHADKMPELIELYGI